MNERPTTVKELRELLAQFPDDMPIYSSSSSGSWANPLKVRVARIGRAPSNPKKIVFRGGIEALLFW